VCAVATVQSNPLGCGAPPRTKRLDVVRGLLLVSPSLKWMDVSDTVHHQPKDATLEYSNFRSDRSNPHPDVSLYQVQLQRSELG